MIYLLSPIAKDGTVSLPMIEFTTIENFLDLNGYDILMFSSKQAVKTAEILNKNWKTIPCLSVGKATSKEIISKGGIVLYEPQEFYSKNLNIDIIKKFKDKKILYLRPKEVSFDSRAFLAKNGIDIDEKIIYKTTCKRYDKKDRPKKGSTIIFTSPSTIRCFLKNFKWHSSYIAIVIGESTKNHLPKNIEEVFVAPTSLIDSCIVLAQGLKK